MERNRDDAGFTLVELLTIAAIIGFLVLIAMTSYGVATNRAESVTCESNRRALDGAVEIYYGDNQTYPATIDDLSTLIGNFSSAKICPSGPALDYDPVAHDVSCPVHGN